MTAVSVLLRGDLTFGVSLLGHTSWQCAGHAIVQPFPHKVCVEKHEGHDGDPAAQLRRAQPPHDARDVAVAPVDDRGHGPACPQQAEQRPGLQPPQFALQQVAARARHAALAGLHGAGPRLQQRPGRQRRCRRRPRAAADGARGFHGHPHGGEHAADEDAGEEGEEAPGLASEVGREHAATPVQRGQQVAHAAAQADHAGEHGEGLAVVLLVLVQVRQKSLQRREAHLSAEVQEAHPEDEEAHLKQDGRTRVNFFLFGSDGRSKTINGCPTWKVRPPQAKRAASTSALGMMNSARRTPKDSSQMKGRRRP